MISRLLKLSNPFQALVLLLFVTVVQSSFAEISNDQKYLMGRWKLIESKAFFADGRETVTRSPCWIEYSESQQSSECETPQGKKQAFYRLKLIAPGKYMVSRSELGGQKNSTELVSDVDYRIEGRFLYLTVRPEPRSERIRNIAEWNPVRLEVMSVRE